MSVQVEVAQSAEVGKVQSPDVGVLQRARPLRTLAMALRRAWEWLTQVKPYESWRYDAIGKPLWSTATGHTRLEDLGDGRTRVHFEETYHAFNPVMRVLLERYVHRRLSRDNDTILAAIEGGVRWHRKRKGLL